MVKKGADVLERIPSGIAGLNNIIEGGLEKNSAILVSGGGGSGKTIFGLQFLIEGIKKFDETGIYISFEESKSKFYRHMLRFGWDLESLEKHGRFVYVKYTPEGIAKIVKNGGKSLGSLIKQAKGKRIVLDSLSAYTALFDKESMQRKMLVDLFSMIESWECTTVVIAEEDPDITRFHSSVMGFMADAIIYLYNIMKDNKLMIRAIQVAKMRGTKHNSSIIPLSINNNGIEIFPNQEIYEIELANRK
jgi:circadian clock protein KaiC